MSISSPLSPTNPVCFLDVSINDQPSGRIEITLRADIVPQTAENFRLLCVGQKSTPHRNLWYKDCLFHSENLPFICIDEIYEVHNFFT